MQIKHLLLATALLLGCSWARAQEGDDLVGANCTSIMVGKAASADGSVITSHTCDGRYRTWVTMEPAADHPAGATHKVYKGTMHTAFPGSMEGVTLAGEIPQAAHTYAYMNTAYPCLNEKQLAMGESTFTGPDTLQNPDAMFMIEELQRIALQRCDNARDAILLIGKLVREHGYADGGECITIADRDEVWQMEILGEGRGKIGGIWAARRVPDDHVAVSCNIARIGKLDRKDKANFLCSDNIEKVAREHGLWDGKGDFVWWKAFPSSYSGDKNHREREWYILNELAPSLNLDIDDPDLPFSVKPEQEVSAEKVMELFRATYEGTPLDQVANLVEVKKSKDDNGAERADTVVSAVANPWMSAQERALYNQLRPGTVTFYRGVAMSWCSYSTVIQCRSWLPDEIGALCWFSFENPGQSPRVPIYAGATRLPAGFDLCGHARYDERAALWHYRKANKLAQISWGKTKKTMLGNVLRYERKAFDELPALELIAAARLRDGKREETLKLLDQYTADFAAATRQTWQQMEHSFWETFWKGF